MTETNNTGVTLTEVDLVPDQAPNPIIDTTEQEVEVTLRAVIIYDDAGNYLIHGASDQSPNEMFKAMHTLWDLDPSKETVKLVELPVRLFKPTFEVRPYVTK